MQKSDRPWQEIIDASKSQIMNHELEIESIKKHIRSCPTADVPYWETVIDWHRTEMLRANEHILQMLAKQEEYSRDLEAKKKELIDELM